MRTPMPNSRRPKYYSLTEAAWLLGVSRAAISKAIRTGTLPVVSHRGRLVVPAHVLVRLLNQSAGGGRR